MEMEEWIRDYYDEVTDFFKIRRKLPLVLVKDRGYYGRCRSVKYTIRETNTLTHKSSTFETGWQQIEIELDEEFTKICYEYQETDIFPYIIRTLIHELVHQKGYEGHTKKFKRMERRMFIRWVSHLMNKTKKEITNDKELMEYIFKYDLM